MIIDREFVTVSCIESNINNVKSDIVKILNESDSERQCIVKVYKSHELVLPDQPYNTNEKKIILWEPICNSDKTLFMANFSDGWMTLINILGTSYKHKCFRLRLTPEKTEWPVWSLSFYDNGIEKRVLQVLKDSTRWQFYQSGEMLDCEIAEYYKKRKIKDRFNYNILLTYMKKFGWNLEEKDFWETNKTNYEIVWH